MFEYNIQKAWDEYERDLGLGRVALFTCFFNAFLVALGFFFTGNVVIEPFIPIIISLVFFQLRRDISKLSIITIFAINAVAIGITISLNYYLVGLYDQLAGGLFRYDKYLNGLDYLLFGKPISLFIYSFFDTESFLSILYYDSVQIAYMTFYLFPFLGGILYFIQLSKNNKYKIGRFISSIAIYFNLNFLFYLVIPVTGPQYSIP